MFWIKRESESVPARALISHCGLWPELQAGVVVHDSAPDVQNENPMIYNIDGSIMLYSFMQLY